MASWLVGPYLLIILFDSANTGEGVAVHELPSRADCEVVAEQLKPLAPDIRTVCVAARAAQ